jgi:hypothetical protein
MINPPSPSQLESWLLRLSALIVECEENRFSTFDLHTVKHRIIKEQEKKRTLEAGCAYRIMRLAAEIRAAGHMTLSAALYDLARELIAYECSPSPRWLTMCRELEFEAIPTGTEND